jgi:hypothetical protein
MTAASVTHPETRMTEWIKHGLIGGLVAGIAFAIFEMIMAVVLDGAAAFFMPLRMIGAMALGEQALDPAYSLPTAAATGIGVHLILSMLYGVAVAGAARYVPALAGSAASLVAWASAAGLGLWLVNFYVFAPAFGWTWFPQATNPIVQAIAHTVFYGTILGIYLNLAARRA